MIPEVMRGNIWVNPGIPETVLLKEKRTRKGGKCTHRLGKQRGEERSGDEVWYIGKRGKDGRKTQDWRVHTGRGGGAVCFLDGLLGSQVRRGWKVWRGHGCPVCRQLTTLACAAVSPLFSAQGENSLSNLPSSLQMSFLLGCEKT